MTHAINRRDFISRAALVPAGIAAGIGLGTTTALAQTPIKRVGGSKLKTSLNAFSFNKDLRDGKMTLSGLLDFCAKQNFDAVDPTGYYFPGYPKVPTDEFINNFKRQAFTLGLDISGTGVKNDFATPDKANRAKDVVMVKQWIEVAAKLGAPVIRVFSGPSNVERTFNDTLKWMVPDLQACVEHGKKYGVLVGIQHHGDTLKTGEEVLQVLKLVNSEWFGVVVDTGLFLTPDPYKDIAMVAPFAVNWQIKERLGKNNDVKQDLKKLVTIIKASGYRGYIPIETLAAPGEKYDPYTKVPKMLQELRAELQG